MLRRWMKECRGQGLDAYAMFPCHGAALLAPQPWAWAYWTRARTIMLWVFVPLLFGLCYADDTGFLANSGEEPSILDVRGSFSTASTAGRGLQEINDNDSDTVDAQATAPGTLHWVLAVILGALLVAGLVRVWRVLHSADGVGPLRQVPEGFRPVECGACRAMQYVTIHGRIFICFSCNAPGRVPVDLPLQTPFQDLEVASGPLRRYEFRKEGENFWQELKSEVIDENQVPSRSRPSGAGSVAGASGTNGTQEPSPTVVGSQALEREDSTTSLRTQISGALPQCVVCLDSIGNMVMVPCGHGGICEDCTARIVQNRASGGSHCPHCRSVIKLVVKIREVDGEIARGIEHRIPMVRHTPTPTLPFPPIISSAGGGGGAAGSGAVASAGTDASGAGSGGGGAAQASDSRDARSGSNLVTGIINPQLR